MVNVSINPFGAVPVFDGESPRIVTGKAAATLSGGNFVVFSGAAAGTVGSSLSQFSAADLVVNQMVNPHQVNGLLLQNVASGGYCSVARGGTYIGRAGTAISGGNALVATATGDCVNAVGIGSTGSIAPIGRALSNAGSEAFVLFDLLL